MRQPTTRRFLSVLLAAGLLASACSSSSDDEALDTEGDTPAASDDATVGSDETTDDPADQNADGDVSTEAPADGAQTDDGQADPGTTDSGSGQAAPADPGPATPAPAPQAPPASQGTAPGKATVAKSGTFTYATTRKTTSGTETSDTNFVVKRLSGDDTSGRIMLSFPTEQGTLDNEVDITPDGQSFDISYVRDTPLGDVTCDWMPNWTFLGKLAKDSTWSWDSECDDTAKGVHIETDGSGTVVGFEVITVNGESINTWVIDTKINQSFTVTALGSGSTKSTGRTWFDPARGMSVRRTSHDVATGDFGEGTSDSTDEFKSFKAG